jgi:curli biogenesis system outer membrane secretion channel CsgG
MRRALASCSALLLCGLACFGQAQKRRVAVLDFDYGTVQSSVAAVFGQNEDVGKGISDLLINQLVKAGDYEVIERQAINKIVAEQNFSNSYRADSTTAVKLGKLLGVNDIIIGSVTQFGRDDQNKSYGGAALGSFTGRFGIGGLKKKKARAVVGISARLVDVQTGQILAVADGKGASTRSGVSIVGAGGGAGGVGAGGLDMSSSNFGATLLGEAVHQAVDSVASQFDAQAGKLPEEKISVQGLIAYVSGSTLILDVGSNKGAQVGETLGVYRKVADIRDPATGKIIRTLENKLGDVKVTEVEALSAQGTYSGSVAPKVGDIVKSE